jgi:uncharacterized membrane protein YkvI
MLSTLMSTSRIPLPSSLLLALLAPLTVLLSGCGGDLFDRLSQPRWGLCGTVIIILDIIALLDLLGDEGRSVTNRVVWALLIIFFPVGGVILYFLFGRE